MSEFERFIQPYKRVIERYVIYRIPDEADAEDVLQEIWFAVYMGYKKILDCGYQKSWIVSIARNKCADYFRDRAKRLGIPIDDLIEVVQVNGLYDIEEKEMVRCAIGRLGDIDKQILYLYYFKDMPQNEIAKILNISCGTVKSRLYRAKNRLKKEFDNDDT